MATKSKNEDASSTLLEFASGAQGVYTQVVHSKHAADARTTTLHPPKALDHFGGDNALADSSSP